jgi:hypothetical protein
MGALCAQSPAYSGLFFAIIHRSAWKRNSRKFVSKILHSPGPMGPATLDSPGPVPNPKPYMLWWCIKIRSGAYPALR